MAHGLQVYARDGTLRLDTTSATELLVDSFLHPAGNNTTTRTYNTLPTGIQLRAALLQITDVPVDTQQLVPTSSVTYNSGNNTWTVQIVGTTGFITNQEEVQVVSQTAQCQVLVLGK